MLRLLILFLLLPFLSFAQAPADTRQLMPVPNIVQWGSGRLALPAAWRVRIATDTDPAVRAGVERFNTWLSTQAGGPKRLPSSFVTGGAAELTVTYSAPLRATLSNDESYSLQVTSAGVALSAPAGMGVLRGLATLQQLLTRGPKNALYFPETTILDKPRFAWRGLLIDAARHFMPVSVIKRNLDAMAAVKLNVLHWHLSDDQGFRVESKVLPRLHEVGGANGYYTQAQVREIVAYAAARGIRVVPEFDVPGHTTAWIAAYPELASNDSTYGVSPRWGVLNIAIDPTRESTYQLLDKVLTEMSALFPDEYFHIGGDENDGRQWRRNPRIAAWMRENGFVKAADNKQLDKHALQTYFNRRMLQKLNGLHKKMVGWDEILGPDLPESTLIQSWRGQKGLVEAVKLKHQALLSSGYYLDLNYSAAAHYAVDPIPANTTLSKEEQYLVLGGEAAMWAEFADSVIVDSRIWPRAAVVAERLWSPASVTNVPDMYRRMALVSAELETLGLQHRRAPEQLLTMMAAGHDVAPLRTLASVLEPVKDYKRHFQGFKYTTSTPLNRLVDAAPAESEAARQFSVTLDSLLRQPRAAQGRLSSAPEARRLLRRVQAQLKTWQQNDARVQPLLKANPSLQEYAPLSAQLKTVATLALQRLDQLEKGQTPPADWLAAAQKQLDAAKQPAGQTELALATKLGKQLLMLP
ncbi:family 20 glycosylhydrolase [Hymenobacter busanensis]|uniref:Family 20 glycosylhydrolase n=1 Tax=Hymenobacter busanensis TaxID=2607656 RepID=A0A7L5A0M0_9BACT|nr:family 20 glycosylhydrolase [Hymenobacter busanensis]KAA9338253.1 family 20 glycosylhydrolase [Hymenobacter busanensis]QHJ09324.1 family 20 glycosylhydrolase [Hymenobacter busanensis]